MASRIKMADATPDTPLERVIGVGPKTAERFREKGIESVMDALLFLPRRYENRSNITPIVDLTEGPATVSGEVRAAAARFRGRRVYEVALADETGILSLRFFRFKKAVMENRFPLGARLTISGRVSHWGAQVQMVHPEVEKAESSTLGILPIYPEIEGVPKKKVRTVVTGLAEQVGSRVQDPLPEALRADLSLPDLSAAIRTAHGPATADRKPLEEMRRRLIFDELFFFQLALALSRKQREDQPGVAHGKAALWEQEATQLFPFPLTSAQRRTMGEIAHDLGQPQPMNRLLQGDVGSGKTAVALLAALLAGRSGHQVALLVPTEILAAQHAQTARRLFAEQNLNVALLTKGTRTAERKEILTDLMAQRIDLLIGTHALLEEDVQLRSLGLLIIDEQHRFGVEQRSVLRSRRADHLPDLLVMTATPIPRTLALTVYGDLRVSLLDELPPGRSPTKTKILDGSEQMHEPIQDALKKGQQAYVVYPLVEASRKLDLAAATDAVKVLEQRYRPFTVALLTGRMKSSEKEAVMDRFVKNEISVLVSTTVVEVGVDVPNATVMVVLDAGRFGLSQIHQLRGRVGRGTHPGLCLLVKGEATEDALQRLRVIESTTDGFVVAERDLEIRGQGEVLGTRQSGMPALQAADLVRDARIVGEAREHAFGLIDRDPQLARHESIRGEVERRFAGKLRLASA